MPLAHLHDAPAPASPSASPSLTGRDEDDVRLAALAVVVAVAAVGLACWRAAGAWVPTTDWALIEHQVRNVWTSPPLLGAPSSVGFHHPGPLPYLVLAPLYQLFGGDPRALALATGALSCASVAAVGVTAWRRGGLLATLVASIGVVWLAGSLPAGTLVDPWNPWVAVLPFAWLLTLVWSLLDDDLGVLPLAVVAASFVVQAHVAYLVPVGALAVLVVVGVVRNGHLVWRRRPSEEVAQRRRRLARALALGAAVGVLCWVGPVVDQLTAEEPNLGRGIEYATGDEAGDRLDIGDALGVAATELGWPGPWQTGAEPFDELALQVRPSPWWRLLVPLAALGVGWVAAADDRSARHLLVVAGTAWAASVLAVAQLEVGGVFTYAVRFAWVASMAAGVAVALALARALRRARPSLGRALAAIGLIGLVVASGRAVVVAGDAELRVYSAEAQQLEQRCLDQLLPEIRRAAGDGPVHVRLAEFWPILSAPIVNELDRAGLDVAVDERFGFHLQRDGRDARADEVALVVAQESLVFDWEDRPGVTELVRCDLLTPAQRQELDDLLALESPSSLDQVVMIDLLRKADRTVVFVDGRER